MTCTRTFEIDYIGLTKMGEIGLARGFAHIIMAVAFFARFLFLGMSEQ